MDSKKIFSFRTRLFFLVNIFFWMLVAAFVSIQYLRESEYKVSMLDTRLQVYNNILLKEYEAKDSLTNDMINELIGNELLRVTMLDLNGNVIFDNFNENMGNHKDRPEIQKALSSGVGFTIRRISETDKHEYFYSATEGRKVIIRSALPYDVSLANILKGDVNYIGIVLAIAVIINIILYFAISRMSLGVQNLWKFARMVEDGGDINEFDTTLLPNDELGEVSSVIVNLYKERDRQYQKSQFEINEKIRIKHQLTNNINHELKTPVQSIMGSLETLIHNGDALTPELRNKLINTGYENSLRLSELLQDITLLSRITDAKDTFAKSRINIGGLVNDVVRDIVSIYGEQKMRINVNLPEDVEVEGNQLLLESIFRNMINNSIQYSGGRDVFINLLETTDTHYVFDFHDNGTGVDNAHLDRIFERFYRLDSGRSRKDGGTGIGLSIVKNAVLFHNGTIEARNMEFAGLQFIFSIHK